MTGLSHLDASGAVHMVDIGDKTSTDRRATASAEIRMQPETLALILEQGLAKGDVLAVARIAGIQAAKRCDQLIPLCHSLPLAGTSVEFQADPIHNALLIVANCRVVGQTGVEMEALTAVSVAALTVYDMCKSVDRGMVITNIQLVHKSGGRSGSWERPDDGRGART